MPLITAMAPETGLDIAQKGGLPAAAQGISSEGPNNASASGGSSASKTLHAEHDIGKLKVLQAASNDTMAKKYAMSVMAASVAEGATYPLDLTKTR